MNTLKQLLQEVNTIGFWSRIFGWNRIKQLLATAIGELDVLADRVSRFESDNAALKSDYAVAMADLKSRETRQIGRAHV